MMRLGMMLLVMVVSVTPVEAISVLGGLALRGMDPVSIMLMPDAPKQGQKNLALMRDYRVYYFFSEENLKLFQEHPERYTPAFGGLCAYQLSLGKVVEANPMIFLKDRESIYFFATYDSRNIWLAHAADNASKAQSAWKTLIPQANLQ